MKKVLCTKLFRETLKELGFSLSYTNCDFERWAPKNGSVNVHLGKGAMSYWWFRVTDGNIKIIGDTGELEKMTDKGWFAYTEIGRFSDKEYLAYISLNRLRETLLQRAYK